MKNQIVFPVNYRLFEQQRRTLERALEVFPMDVIITDSRFNSGIVYPHLIFSKKSRSAMKHISGSLLTPNIESGFYTLKFNADVVPEFHKYPHGKRYWRYELFREGKSEGTFMYSELWEQSGRYYDSDKEYPKIFPPNPLTFRVGLAIPLKKLVRVDGKILFPSEDKK